MNAIHFFSRRESGRFHNPLAGGKLEAQEIEVREDPLLGHQSLFNPALAGKVALVFPPTDQAYLAERVEESVTTCFLCEGRWKVATPTWEEAFAPGGRVVKGRAVAFPNLFPLAGFHAVVMVGDEHRVATDEFSVELATDGFSAALEVMRRGAAMWPEYTHWSVNGNYLFPAGASIIHPHFQVLGSPGPGTRQARLIRACGKYLEKNGSEYFADLSAQEERDGARFLGRTGRAAWFTAFSPIGANEVQAVCKDLPNLSAWTEEDAKDLARGFCALLKGLHALDRDTFNFSLFGASETGPEPGVSCLFSLVTRQNPFPHYRADDHFFQKTLENETMLYLPEDLARRLRAHFPR